MRLLVTNTHTPQAYAIIRALRPFAGRIVATVEGDGLRARLSHAANSRLVDVRRRVPSVAEDWSAARVSHENTPREESFITAIERIADEERIDTIFPSWDPFVSVFSRNRDRLARRGITIPVPEFATVLAALDKYRTIEAAQAVGFPCPRTYLFESLEQARDVADREGFPLVIKPRFTSGGRGMAVVRNHDELAAALSYVVEHHGKPLIQEYIPGGERDSVQFVIGRDGRVLFVFHKHRLRTFRRTARFGTVSESAVPDERLARSAALLERLGWWGAMGIETIRDPRDGVHKLMEVNPRFPRQLWNRTELGINEPLMCLQIARGEAVCPVEPCPVGVLFVSPIEDVQLLGLQIVDLVMHAARGVAGRAPIDETARPLSLAGQLRSFGRTYVSRRRKVWDPYFRYFLQDPVTSMLWWAQFSTWMAGALRHVGR